MTTATVRRRSVSCPGGRGRRGLATVELAVLMPVLTVLLFGTLEFGLMAKNSQALNHIAREGARAAAKGAVLTRIRAQMADASPDLDAGRIQTSLEYRRWDTTAETWGGWMTLTDQNAENCALSGDQIRVSMQYSYELATGGLFADLFNASADNSVTVDATIVAMRE